MFYAEAQLPSRDYSVYVDGVLTQLDLHDVFRGVYSDHLDCLMTSRLTPARVVDLVFYDDSQHVQYHTNDIVGACERYCPWLTSFHYLLLTQAGGGAFLRSRVIAKLNQTRFRDRIIEEARKRNE